MVKKVLFFVVLFALGMLSASITLSNPGKDCKNLKPCPGHSCGKEHGHFSRCSKQLPTITIPTLTLPTTTDDLPTVSIPTVPLPTTTNEPRTTTSPPNATTTTKPDTTTTKQPNPTTTNSQAVTTSKLPANPPVTTVYIPQGENVLRTLGTNLASSIVGLIIGVLGSWLWCTRIKK